MVFYDTIQLGPLQLNDPQMGDIGFGDGRSNSALGDPEVWEALAQELITLQWHTNRWSVNSLYCTVLYSMLYCTYGCVCRPWLLAGYGGKLRIPRHRISAELCQSALLKVATSHDKRGKKEAPMATNAGITRTMLN